jgi:hypothetical protein
MHRNTDPSQPSNISSGQEITLAVQIARVTCSPLPISSIGRTTEKRSRLGNGRVFPRKSCDNRDVDEKSKRLGCAKEKCVVNGAESKRRCQPNSRVRLSPLDFLSLIQEPFPSMAATDNFLARDLARTFKWLERLERLAARKGLVLAPRRVHVPSLSKLDALERGRFGSFRHAAGCSRSSNSRPSPTRFGSFGVPLPG